MPFKDFSLMVGDNKADAFESHLREGRIMMTRCKDCGAEFYPPQLDCSACINGEVEWAACPTEGTLAAYTRVMVLPKHFALPEIALPFGRASLTPSPVGLLEVKPGLRIMGWIPKTGMEALRVGQPMAARAEALKDGRVTIVLENI